MVSQEGLRRVIRTFFIAFAGILIPGALSWLNDLTQWSKGDGQRPFPDAHSLAFLGISAICAGFIALLNLVVVWLEDATGSAVLRNPVKTTTRTQRGRADVLYVLLVVLVIIVILYLVL